MSLSEIHSRVHSASIRAEDETVLEPGMTLCIEPGFFIPDWAGASIEMVLLGESLARSSRIGGARPRDDSVLEVGEVHACRRELRRAIA